MLRDILFRGKRIDNGEWVEGYYVYLEARKIWSHRIYTSYAEVDVGDFYPDFFEVVPSTVSQSTGLTDKNGKRIFEGDLITIPGSKRQGLPAPVKWSNFDARFEVCRRGFNPICLDGDEGIFGGRIKWK